MKSGSDSISDNELVILSESTIRLSNSPVTIVTSSSSDRLMAASKRLQTIAAPTPTPNFNENDVPFSPIRKIPPHMTTPNNNSVNEKQLRRNTISLTNKHKSYSSFPSKKPSPPLADNPSASSTNSFRNGCWQRFSAFFRRSPPKQAEGDTQVSSMNENQQGAMPVSKMPTSSSY